MRYIILLIFVFSFDPLIGANDNKIIIKVNDKIVSSFDVKNKINTELMLRNLPINQLNINKMKNLAIKELINMRIKEGEILRYSSINLDEIDISKQLKSISSNNIGEFKKKFLINNLSYEIFIEELKIQSGWQNLIFNLFKNKVKVNENEILDEVKKIKNKISKIKEYDLSEIELSFNNLKEKDEKILIIKNKINEIGFENTVLNYSESDSAINNGRIGLVNEQSLSSDVFDRLKKLQEGEISSPIIKVDKIIFLKVNKIKISNNDNINIDKLKKDIINQRKNDLFNLYSASHLSKIRNNSYIEFK
tara:strand:+ start:38 stop:955 length:918 start_codon:yes stop_codon:yes gene_type:complete